MPSSNSRERNSIRVSSEESQMPAQVVGNAFVAQFYRILHDSPQLAHKFYKEISILDRPDQGGNIDSVTTMRAINEKILEMDYSELKAEIRTVAAQESLGGGVIVLVTGYLTRKDTIKKGFTQSFFLAPQVKGLFVLNDLFRYVNEDDNKLGNIELVNGTVTSSSSEQGIPIRSAKQMSKKGRKTMILYQSSSIGSQPPAELVGNAFVQQFYHMRHQSPKLVYRFYQESSKLDWSGPNGVMESVTTLQAINEKILATDFSELKAKIKSVDVQESLNGGVIVLVTGFLLGKDTVKKGFTQSFFLAPQDKGFFVLNDIFRYLGENSCNPSTPEVKAPTPDPINDAPAPSAPPYSLIVEDSQLAMAIRASIQSAMAEGVLNDLNELDIRSNPGTRDSNDGSSISTITLTSCVICLDAQVEGACIPCGHMAGCMSCLNEIKDKKWGCPVCRAKIDQIVRIYAV